jgi:hypothetical protein
VAAAARAVSSECGALSNTADEPLLTICVILSRNGQTAQNVGFHSGISSAPLYRLIFSLCWQTMWRSSIIQRGTCMTISGQRVRKFVALSSTVKLHIRPKILCFERNRLHGPGFVIIHVTYVAVLKCPIGKAAIGFSSTRCQTSKWTFIPRYCFTTRLHQPLRCSASS